MTTKQQFISTYRQMLMDTPDYHWVHDADRLEKFISSVNRTLFTQANTWDINSPVARKAWKKIGGTGKLSYKALRALPNQGD